MRRLAITCLILITATTAHACINDSELPQREREFRSQYMNHALTLAEPSESRPQSWSRVNRTIGVSLVAIAIGAGLLRDAV